MLTRGRVAPLVLLAALACGQQSPAAPVRGGGGGASSAGVGGGSASGSSTGGGSSSGAITGGGSSAGASAGGGSSSGAITGGGSSAGASAGASAATGAAASAMGDGGSGRVFPDTNATIAILADQFPTMNDAQIQFAATHYVGTEKQLLSVTQALRAINPSFLVLHYHLSMWQSAPATDFILDGTSWGNDYPTVTTHEDWFWHNAAGARVPSSADGKLLMNVSVAGFQAYWASSLAAQVAAGEYDAVFFDSASPALLQGECGTVDPRLAGTAAASTLFDELGGHTWIDAWQTWMSALASTLAAQGIALIPNTSAFVTGWDTTNYGLTPGIFSEGFAGLSFAESDWQASTTELLKLAAADKIMILQNYLASSTDVGTRLYYLGNYLLVKGHHTYLDYFAQGPLEWYPEWQLDLGAPMGAAPTDAASLLAGGVYRRDFAKGSVLVNPSAAPVTVALGGTFQEVVPTGGGPVDTSGTVGGTVVMVPVSSVIVAPTSATIVLR
jgi:Hypothetical glycosyl hydrolase family 15